MYMCAFFKFDVSSTKFSETYLETWLNIVDNGMIPTRPDMQVVDAIKELPKAQ